MKKVILGLMLLLGAQSVSASGLYVSGGYGSGDPDWGFETLSAASSQTGNDQQYEGLNGLPGWPGGSNSTANGYWAEPWVAGLRETEDFIVNDASTYSVAIGWDLKRNPFRVEGEYKSLTFSARDSVLTIYDPTGVWCPTNSSSCPSGGIPTGSYEFDTTYGADYKVDVTAYMANVYFELPYFKDFDPYIGYGLGMAKVDASIAGVDVGSDGNVRASQIIAGVEYRFEDSPVIAGLEYRRFSVDYDDNLDKEPHKLDHSYFMFKLRYDFVSDVY